MIIRIDAHQWSKEGEALISIMRTQTREEYSQMSMQEANEKWKKDAEALFGIFFTRLPSHTVEYLLNIAEEYRKAPATRHGIIDRCKKAAKEREI